MVRERRKDSPAAVEARRARIMQLLRQGSTAAMMAPVIGLSYSEIKREYSICVKQLRDERSEDTQAFVDTKLAELAEVKRVAWIEYNRSLKNIRKKETQKVPEVKCPLCDGTGYFSDDVGLKIVGSRKKPKTKCKLCKGRKKLGGVVKVTDTTAGRLGDESFLRLIKDIVDQECQLQGAYPAKELNVQETRTTVDWRLILAALPDGPIQDPLQRELEKLMARQIPLGAPAIIEGTATESNGEAE